MDILSKISKKKVLDDSSNEEKNLPRTLGLFDLLMMGIGGTVGSGVFATSGIIAKEYAGPAAILSWLIAGIGCLLSGVSFMELSRAIPASGSSYSYSYCTLGEFPAMIAGFLLTLEYGVASAGVARSWSSKMTIFLASVGINTPNWMNYGCFDFSAGVLMVLVVTIVANGIELGKNIINVITIIKISVVLFIIIVGILQFDRHNFLPFIPSGEIDFQGERVFGLSGIMLGASASFFGYIGYGGEAKNPQRNLPLAILGTILGASLLSTLATFSLVGMQKYSSIDTESAFGGAFESVGLVWARYIASIGEVVTMPVGVLVGVIAQPRLQYAMSMDGLLPKLFSKTESNGNLFWGTLIAGGFLVGIASLVEFKVIWDIISLGILMAFNLTNCSLILLRKSQYNHLSGNSSTSTSLLVSLYMFTSLAAAYSWQNDVISQNLTDLKTTGALFALFFTMISFFLIILLWWSIAKPSNYQNENDFTVPFVPFTPCLAIFFNWFLFVQMNWKSILLLLAWISVAIFIYITYGFSHSKINNPISITYEMVELKQIEFDEELKEDTTSENLELNEVIAERSSEEFDTTIKNSSQVLVVGNKEKVKQKLFKDNVLGSSNLHFETGGDGGGGASASARARVSGNGYGNGNGNGNACSKDSGKKK